MALAGAALTGASSFIGPGPAHAISDMLVNGGVATAGAAVASAALRAARSGAEVEAPVAEVAAATAVEPLLQAMPKPSAPVEQLGKRALVKMLLAQIPTWQRVAAVATPSLALVGVVAASKRWVTIETARLTELQLNTADGYTKEIADLKKNLEKMTKTSEAFEAKLKVAEADLEVANDTLGLSQSEVRAVTKALGAVTTESKAQAAKLDEMEASARAEMKKRADEFQAQLEAQASETAELRKQLGVAKEEALEALAAKEKTMTATKEAVQAMKDQKAANEVAEAAAAKARLSLEQELQQTKQRLKTAEDAVAAHDEKQIVAKAREEWEADRKANFFALEEELEEISAKLEAAESTAKTALKEAETFEKAASELEEERDKLKVEMEKLKEVAGRAKNAEEELKQATAEAVAARAEAEAAAEERKAAVEELAAAKSEMEEIQAAMKAESAEARAAEEALTEAVAETQRLRKEMDALHAQKADVEAALEEARLASDADAQRMSDLKEAYETQVWQMEGNIRELEETMETAHDMARASAERMLLHHQRMGRVIHGKDKGEADIPVKFEIKVETKVGQRVAMVGSWNDWSVEDAFPMRWTEGNIWTVTTPIHADDAYEYKYVIIDDKNPDPLTNATWQYGNNRTLALQLSLHDEVVLVEVTDSWIPNPKASPILLHQMDGTVEEVGSTTLLRDCVRGLRTEQALLDGSEYVRVLQDIETLTVSPAALKSGEEVKKLNQVEIDVAELNKADVDVKKEKMAEITDLSNAKVDLEMAAAMDLEVPDLDVPAVSVGAEAVFEDQPEEAELAEDETTLMSKTDGTLSELEAEASADQKLDKGIGAR